MEKSQIQTPELINDMYNLGDVDSVNFVLQNDDITNQLSAFRVKTVTDFVFYKGKKEMVQR